MAIKVIKESVDDLQGTFKFNIPDTYTFDKDDVEYMYGWCEDYISGAYIIDIKLVKDNKLVIDFEIEDPSEISKKQVLRNLHQALYDYLNS